MRAHLAATGRRLSAQQSRLALRLARIAWRLHSRLRPTELFGSLEGRGVPLDPALPQSRRSASQTALGAVMEGALTWRPFGGFDLIAIAGTVRYSIIFYAFDRFDAFRSENGERKWLGKFPSSRAAQEHIEGVERERQRSIRQRMTSIYDPD